MTSLTHQAISSSFLLPHRHYPNHHFSKKIFFLCSKPLKLSSLSSKTLLCPCSSSSTNSSSSIFLPFLEEPEQEEPEYPETHNHEEAEEEVEEVEEEEEEEITDPIIRFFKSRTSTKNPSQQGSITLQKNRRSSWHLAPNISFEEDPESESESSVDVFTEESQRTGFNNDGGGEESTEGVAGEILLLARTLPENCTLGEMLEGFEGRVSENDCVKALVLMGEDGLMKSCLYLFEWMRLQEPCLVTPKACSVLFTLLGRARMGAEMLVLFRNLPMEKEFRDVRLYNAAISGLLSSGRYDDAWSIYDAMEKDNVMLDRVTCSIMITVMRKSGRSAKDAWEFFERMNRKGVEWSPEVLGGLIKSFCDEGLKQEALIIQAEMEKKGLSSNAIVYNTLMDAYCKSNQIEEVEGLFSEMKSKGVKPTSASFNILMDAYSRRVQPEIVEKLLLEMKDNGLEPNARSYTCLISAYGRQKKTSDMAADAFLRMKKSGINPTSHSYTALIHAYSISGWHEKANITFEKMLKEGVKPSIETYTALLDAFRRAGDTQALMKIWKLMIREKVQGTRVTFNTLLDGFAKQGQYVEARDVISEFGKIGLQPTVMTYNMLINAYARGGQESKLPQLLKDMATLNLKPDSITYSTMIYAYFRVRDFKRAFYYHKQMVKSGQVPDAKSYEKLRSLLDVKAATKNRKDKSAILGIIKSKLGRVKPKKKGKKDEFWKNHNKHLRPNKAAPKTELRNGQ